MKLFTGKVINTPDEKTVVVEVQSVKIHPKYRKRMARTKTYLAENEMSSKIGDQVVLVETRPLSKRKKWRVQEIVAR